MTRGTNACKAVVILTDWGDVSGTGTGDSLLLYATPGFVLYQWSNGAEGDSIMVRNTGAYYCTVTDADGPYPLGIESPKGFRTLRVTKIDGR